MLVFIVLFMVGSMFNVVVQYYIVSHSFGAKVKTNKINTFTN